MELKEAQRRLDRRRIPVELGCPRKLPAAPQARLPVVQDILPNALSHSADVLLPSAAWAEKDGCWENFAGKIQPFAAAIRPPEGARREGDVYYRCSADRACTTPRRPHRKWASRSRRQAAGKNRPKPRRSSSRNCKWRGTVGTEARRHERGRTLESSLPFVPPCTLCLTCLI